jgi:hypothetical protein
MDDEMELVCLYPTKRATTAAAERAYWGRFAVDHVGLGTKIPGARAWKRVSPLSHVNGRHAEAPEPARRLRPHARASASSALYCQPSQASAAADGDPYAGCRLVGLCTRRHGRQGRRDACLIEAGAGVNAHVDARLCSGSTSQTSKLSKTDCHHLREPMMAMTATRSP